MWGDIRVITGGILNLLAHVVNLRSRRARHLITKPAHLDTRHQSAPVAPTMLNVKKLADVELRCHLLEIGIAQRAASRTQIGPLVMGCVESPVES